MLANRNGYPILPCAPYDAKNPPLANLLWLFYVSKVRTWYRGAVLSTKTEKHLNAQQLSVCVYCLASFPTHLARGIRLGARGRCSVQRMLLWPYQLHLVTCNLSRAVDAPNVGLRGEAAPSTRATHSCMYSATV